jgi:hypothetical protein
MIEFRKKSLGRMVSTKRRRERTIEEIVADAKAGIFICDPDEDFPRDMFGAPTEDELREEAAMANGGKLGNGVVRRNGRHTSGVATRTPKVNKAPPR